MPLHVPSLATKLQCLYQRHETVNTLFRSWIMCVANAQGRGFVSDDEPSSDALESPGMALRAAVFDSLRPVLGGRSRVILATDGERTRIPFEALPLDSAGRCLADDYRLSYVDTGRDLLRPGLVSNQTSSSPVVIADPDFDLAQRSVVRTLWQAWRSRFARTTTQARSTSWHTDRGRAYCRDAWGAVMPWRGRPPCSGSRLSHTTMPATRVYACSIPCGTMTPDASGERRGGRARTPLKPIATKP